MPNAFKVGQVYSYFDAWYDLSYVVTKINEDLIYIKIIKNNNPQFILQNEDFVFFTANSPIASRSILEKQVSGASVLFTDVK